MFLLFKIYIILEHAQGGDILNLIDTIGIFSEKLARTYLHQIIDSIEYFHKNEIAHRNIKSENIILNGSFCLKLADCLLATPSTSH